MIYRVTYHEHGRECKAYEGHSPREAILECSLLEANGIKPTLTKLGSKGRETEREAA